MYNILLREDENKCEQMYQTQIARRVGMQMSSHGLWYKDPSTHHPELRH